MIFYRILFFLFGFLFFSPSLLAITMPSLLSKSEVHWRQLQGDAQRPQRWVHGSALFDEWHFSEYAWTPEKVIPFYKNGSPALQHVIKKHTRLRIQKVTPTHVQITDDLWILRHTLRISPYHWGYLVTQHKTPLRRQPSSKAKITGHLSAGLKLIPLQFQDGFVQIEWDGHLHFISFHNMLSRLNFAKKIKVKDKWKNIEHVMGSWVKTTDGQLVAIGDIQGLMGGRSMAYVMASKTSIRSKPHNQAPILQTVPQFTPLSLVRIKRSVQTSERLITTDQLFERKVFDVASQTQSLWASANGIFRSFDGHFWEKLAFF